MHHPQHRSQVAGRAMDRWRFLAFEGLAWSRLRAKPTNLDTVENFTAAYRRSATELARVRAFSPDKRLADYIEQAVANAHFAVYRRKRPTMRQILEGALFGVPAAVRRLWRYHLIALLVTAAAATVSYVSVTLAPESYYLFVDRDLAGGRDPSASRDYLASTLGPQETSLGEGSVFSTFLFTHNTKVAFFCFAWGILLGIPTLYLLIMNGLMLGAFLALFFNKGLGVEVVSWLGPHGVPEIGAIILCGGAGLAIGHSVLNPGKLSRQRAITKAGVDASINALGCVPLLLMAGFIEGIFRQSQASIELRYGIMVLMLILCGGWLFFVRPLRAKEVTVSQAA
jgi:uncharacterized membrane protein SpoIIM required for sporulation